MSETIKPSRLDALMSVTYDECSIASAAANQAAHKILATETTQSADYFIIDPGVEPDKLSHLPRTKLIGRIAVEASFTHKSEMGIVLEDQSNLSESEGRNRPRLLAVFNNDIALPFAGFEERLNGECSYVQLGQEIASDNLVVTSRDSRTAHVEAIRELLESKSLSEVKRELIAGLISEEAASYIDVINDVLPKSLSRFVFGKYESMKAQATSRQLYMLSKVGEEAERMDVELIPLMPDERIIGDGGKTRGVRLYYARELDPKQPTKSFFRKSKPRKYSFDLIRLVAVTRDSIAIQIAAFKEHGGCYTENPHGGNFEKMSTDDVVLYRSLLDPEYKPRSTRRGQLTIEELQRELAEFESLNGRNRYFEVIRDIKTEINSKYAEIQTYLEEILNHSGAYEKFNALLGEYDRHSDDLIRANNELLLKDDRALVGTLPNRQIGKTYGDVDVQVEVSTLLPNVLRVSVTGKPTSLVWATPVVVFEEVLYRDKPNELSKEKVTEINYIIKSLLKK